MDRGFGWRLMAGVAILAVAVGIGVYGYDLGLARGLAEASSTLAAPGTGAPIVVYPRPWRFGYGFFPFFPLVFVLSWFFLVRALFWRGGWGRHYGSGVPPAFEEWHRRAHARQEPPPQTNG